MTLTDQLLEQIIEGALMASGQTLSVDRIQNLFEEGQEPDKQRVLIALERLSEKCQNRGYELKKVATGYRFQVKQDISKWVSRLWEEKPQRYSRALLETLSIIAYRQPVTRGEIEDVRGVAVSSHITKTLLEREWVQIVGHRDVPGRPAMFATTKMFLDYFNLETLDQLPTLEEIQEIADANHALELEEKVQEGGFDFSSNAPEEDTSGALESAAEDLIAADALVQKVEDAVFNQPDEDEIEPAQDEELNTASDIPGAQTVLAEMDGQLTAQESEATVEPEMDEDALAQATIARMIAEQEALLSGNGATAKPSNQNPVNKTSANGQSSSATIKEAEETALTTAASIFDAPLLSEPDNNNDAANSEEDELAAAMEEEMIAQLEAEQEDLMNEQAEPKDDKTLSDLASKFE